MPLIHTRDIPAAELLAAYKRERAYRPHWPADPAQGMADPGIVAVLRTLIARVPAYTRGRLDADRAGAALPSIDPPRAVPRPLTPFATRSAGPDRKRLAAGDRDDE